MVIYHVYCVMCIALLYGSTMGILSTLLVCRGFLPELSLNEGGGEGGTGMTVLLYYFA